MAEIKYNITLNQEKCLLMNTTNLSRELKKRFKK